MNNPTTDPVKVLITGGTSGLGLSLVKLFLKKGCMVVATGRQPVTIHEDSERFNLLMTDFSNLRETADGVMELCKTFKFDIVINNAGVLSPPEFLSTIDGFEYTFQVNFLTHLLLNEIILSNADPGQPITILNITSPVYSIAGHEFKIPGSATGYRPFKSYANSKLYLALMCIDLPVKHPSLSLKCIAFDPGIFSSGIYRMQRKWFRKMYKVGSLFMKSPEKIARRIGKLLDEGDLTTGTIYKSIDKKKKIPEGIDSECVSVFWQECYKAINPFLKR